MIEFARIIGFQSHKETELEFVPGINIIVGNSDTGKSSIVRGLFWAFTNNPSGTAYRNWDLKDKEMTEVTTVFTDGKYVCRERNVGKVNQYLIGNEEGEEYGPFKALRTKVPTEVSDVSKMHSVNMQAQKDKFFLLDKSPGQVAKAFNEVSNLEIMDKAIKEVNSRVRKVTSEISSVDSREAELDELIELSDWIDDCEKEFTTIQKKKHDHEELIEKEESLLKIYNGIIEIEKILDELEYVHAAEEALIKLSSKNQELSKHKEQRRILYSTLKTYGQTKKQLNACKDIDEAEKALKSLYFKWDEHVKNEEVADGIESLLDQFDKFVSEIEDLDTIINAIDLDLEEKWKNVQVCPLCESTIGGD